MCLSIVSDTVPSYLPLLIWPPIVLAEAAPSKYNHCLLSVCACVLQCVTHTVGYLALLEYRMASLA